MDNHDIIVIGASAGGVSALKVLFADLPSTIQAAIFVVLHTPPAGPGLLPSILQSQSTLNVDHAIDGDQIEIGRVYVAPPDRHIIVERGHLHLSIAPRENRSRPATLGRQRLPTGRG